MSSQQYDSSRYSQTYAESVAQAMPAERAIFIRRTYGHLAGAVGLGGALLGGLDERLAHETGMPIRVAHEPLYSVVIGSGRALENIDAMRGLMSLGGDD